MSKSTISKTQSSLPSEEAVLILLYGLFASGQIVVRRILGWCGMPGCAIADRSLVAKKVLDKVA